MKMRFACTLVFVCFVFHLFGDFRKDKDFALFFAVKDYEEWSDLRNPIKDAIAIATDLRQIYGFQTEVLENPTLDQIGQKLEAYRQKTYDNDAQLLIFFSGHGEFIESTKEGFFIPKEGKLNDPFQKSYLAHSRLERAITTIPCPHILLAIDACYSGTFDENLALEKGKFGQRPGESIENDRQRFIDRVLTYESRLYLTSGGKERTPDGTKHSPFSTQFLAALRTFGGDDQILDFDELKSYMKRIFPQPHAGQFEGNQPGGDFLFIFDHTSAIDNLKVDLVAWELANSLNTIASFQKYLEQFPDGDFKGPAKDKIIQLEKEKILKEDIEAWLSAKEINTIDAYEKYLQNFPKGKFEILANEAINTILSESILRGNELKRFETELLATIEISWAYQQGLDKLFDKNKDSNNSELLNQIRSIKSDLTRIATRLSKGYLNKTNGRYYLKERTYTEKDRREFFTWCRSIHVEANSLLKKHEIEISN